MKKFHELLILLFLLINITFSDQSSFQDGTVYEINEDIEGTDEYKTKKISYQTTDTIYYFKYDFDSKLPSNLITAFKLDIIPYSSEMDAYKVYCTNLPSSASDSDLKSQLDSIKSDLTKSSCIDIYRSMGYHDSIMKLDGAKTKVGIAVYIPEKEDLTEVQINLRIAERVLGVDETKPDLQESYSMVPVTINIPKFREIPKSKILFYSSTRMLQMFEAVSSDAFPTQLFQGNILNVYTNPNQVLQKYHNATIMTLLANPLGFRSHLEQEKLEEIFKFEVILLESKFLLDYYVSSNAEGRPLNSPLLINMTECTSPYYVILNYNKKETGKTLILDEIYGKLSYLGVATSLTQETWEDMLENDIETINLRDKKYSLPSSNYNIDVYKLECYLPIMLNFYYIDETSPVYQMKPGDVQIFNLQPFQTINVPFDQSSGIPEIIIEINEPDNNPYVIIGITQDTVYQSNTVERYVPMNLNNGITIKERRGSTDTRVIIKAGYPNTHRWETIDNYIKYNTNEMTYLFEFPNDDNKYFYLYANLTISGTNTEDNVKFCFTTSMGGALQPSAENCYRVSSTNTYSLKVYNPLIMYKNYEYKEDIRYSVTLKPFTSFTNFNIHVDMTLYDTNIRNYEGVNNKITLGQSGSYSSILTPPSIETNAIFLQIQVCDSVNSINVKVENVLTRKEILPSEKINPGQINVYKLFENAYMDTEFIATGNKDTEIFLRMVGFNSISVPSFRTNPGISFDSTTNTLTVETPLTTNENWRITVLVDTENTLINAGYTLCSFVNTEFNKLADYYKTITVNSATEASIQIYFNKTKYPVGSKFDALVYFEHLTKDQMVFISKVYQGTVGEITIDTIYELKEEWPDDENYLFKEINTMASYYYFSYEPSSALEVPIGAFSLELEPQTTGSFANVYCAFVSNDSDAMGMIEEVENTIQEDRSYCIGNKSSTTSTRYNYIFKYKYEDDKTPKKLIIKAVATIAIKGNFTIYMKKDQGEYIERTNFLDQREYGDGESNRKSVIPYIVDVEKLRGEDKYNYVSKVLFYSRYLELQMYYVPTDSNKPIKLFSGNIALVYTKPALAEQKYHSTILILFSESLEGISRTTVGAHFRFHTKMFKSDSMIEYFVSQNPDGRTLNFPLSLEMNTCSSSNNKLYYLLNYNQEEPQRRLHLDMIFGNYTGARIATEIKQEKWDDLLSDQESMTSIKNYSSLLPSKPQHIDVIEITCETPLLLNAYYTKDDLIYVDVEKGGVVLRMIPAQSEYQFSFKKYDFATIEYSISLYNPIESPDVTLSFSDGTQHFFTGNSLSTGVLMHIPEKVRVINNCKSETRFIFKFGLAVESSWKEEKVAGLEGKLYHNGNAYVYKFPTGKNKLDFQKMDFLVNSIDQNNNTKFCYSTNLGTAIETSRENCFRTGRFIPYTLTFINPLIMGKNYYTETDRYYVAFRPFEETDSIKIEITENQKEVKNRNELGKAKQLHISNGKVSTILTSPIEPRIVFFQIKSCEPSNEPIQINLTNAFTGESNHSGEIKFTDPYGIYCKSQILYMENQIDLYGEDIKMFTKHAALIGNYTPQINPNYTSSFDSSSNVLSIIKPILGETFNVTVIIKKTSLEDLTICDLSFSDKTELGDYVKSFISTTSDRIIHYIDFSSISGYSKGTKFYALVFAEQMDNSKMEFLYPVIQGEVGSASGTIKVDTIIEGHAEYVTTQFAVKTSSNYLYYDFPRIPTGNVASIRIKADNIHINKIGCTFVSNEATPDEMITAVNKAIANDMSTCIGGSNFLTNGYDALVSAKYSSGNNRLVIQVLYGIGNEEFNEEDMNGNIVIKNRGTDLSTQTKAPSDEPYAPIPYVIDLLKIRGDDKKKDYVSKILFYSSTRQMEMFYIPENSQKPVTLFTGNIMMVYTNEELIKQKYQGSTIMILLTDALSTTERVIFGEQYRFISYFFDSKTDIQYFLSSNPEGRPLNNPTAIEMTSCTQPYYYIMNYNQLEGKERKLHIDTVYGERKSLRIAQSLNQPTWEGLIEAMTEIKHDEVSLTEQSRFHFDVIELKCNVPLLVNLFYTDPEDPKVTNLEMGDITILSLEKGKEESLTFRMGQSGVFVYSFTIEKRSTISPKIEVTFDGVETVQYTENGVYSKYSVSQYSKIVIANKESSTNVNTRVIFKFGFAIEGMFNKDEKGIYSNENDTEKIYNLYGYIYDQTSSKYNYTGVDFAISTTEDNVKFCYSTNLGTYIYPSLQNCYRVGKNNPYTISTLNPNVMYRDYFSDEHINYYVGFRTVELNQNIIITPIINKYDTTERNFEGQKNKVKISSDTGEISTILTAPQNHEPYIFIETCLCTKKAHVSYQFLNAYNHSNLKSNGELNNNNVRISIIENPKLDTELRIYKGKNGNEIFVKHNGYTSNTPLSNKKIEIKYNNSTKVLNWTQPLINENFNYTLYFDKINLIKRQNYTLCHIAEVTRLTHNFMTIESKERVPSIVVDFAALNLKEKEEFDVIIIAEQLEKQKLTFMSATYDSLGGNNEDTSGDDDDNGKRSSNVGLIVVISILSIVIIAGIIASVFIFLKYKRKTKIIDENKQTSMALLNSTQQDKLVESQVQVDP